ncbi:pilus assembly PilX family protein [Lysobacter cavernae]|uniref:pilus assembly PilX family protein n=1 Tax=Lysobacter cavernae TaxID=1685901 RepID=UPI0036DF0A90
MVLILLMVMTLLGLASLRGTLMEERMSANLFDRSLAFQAAESALREAEVRLAQDGIQAKFPTVNCSEGLCAQPVAADGVKERWQDPKAEYFTQAKSVGDLVGQPEYFIEYMGEAPAWTFCDSEQPIPANCMKPRYRITARSSAAGRAAVLLQSNYAAL